MHPINGKVAVIGVGWTNSTRRPTQSLGADGLEACLEAIKDAGLHPSDIDGLCAAGSLGASNISPQEGIGQVTPRYMFKALGLSAVNWTSDGSLLDAAEAVSAGSCDYALAWRCMTYPQGQRYGAVDPGQASGPSEFSYPYGYQISAAGAAGPPSRAVVYQRYMEKYGATRDHMATFIIHNREMALLNDKSFWASERPEHLTKEDYLSARMISDPFCLYDCDIPVQACRAWVVTRTELAKDLPHSPAHLVGYVRGARPDLYQRGVLEEEQEGALATANRLWQITGLKPKDVSTVNLYDGFSMFVYIWLEALGYCKEGEAFEFIQDGRIGLQGELPLCTSGGSLGEGRLWGSAQHMEAVLQAMGRAGARQVKGNPITLSNFGPGVGGEIALFASEPLK
jgi:acetyl-CoA acetyltransferase